MKLKISNLVHLDCYKYNQLLSYNCITIILSQNYISLNLHEYAILCSMKRLTLSVVVLSVFLLTGCDFFRTLAGRPTSKDIDAKQVSALLLEKAELMAANESLEAKYNKVLNELQSVKDSLNALDSISQYGGSVLNPTTLGGLFSTKLEARYYVIVGAFKFRSNAEALYKTAQKKGYRPALISFRNGRMAVGLCPSNNIKDAFEGLKKVKQESFCPSDVWVLLNE